MKRLPVIVLVVVALAAVAVIAYLAGSASRSGTTGSQSSSMLNTASLPDGAKQALDQHFQGLNTQMNGSNYSYQVLAAQQATDPQNAPEFGLSGYVAGSQEIWCVHLSPPAYDMDGLQHSYYIVGRKGNLWTPAIQNNYSDSDPRGLVAPAFLAVGCKA